MNWYLAKIVYRFISGTGQHKPQFNEQLRLVEAEDSLHAFYKARQIGEQETVKITTNGMLIQWQFVDVAALHQLINSTDGAEVWSAMQQHEDAAVYEMHTKQQAKILLQQGLNEFNPGYCS